MTSDPAPRRLRSVLFVDFDNVYSGLHRLDPDIAGTFAQDPGQWLQALERGGEDPEGPFTRRFLTRSCYLNPSEHSRHRPFFTRAGFRVVDCPSLTQQGKSSADINMVLDVMDALGSSTHYDEFVLLSSDADFTPVALRCRAADRRVTVITTGPTAVAYRAVADTVITSDEFVDLILGRRRTLGDSGAGEDGATTFGGGEARPTTERGGHPERRPSAGHSAAARDAVLAYLKASPGPVSGAAAAQRALAVDASLPSTSWEGVGSFVAWALRHVAGVGYSSRPTPGYFWDADRFSEADLPGDAHSSLSPLQQQVAALTETPTIPADHYATLLTALADDINAHVFNRSETSKRVRDACSDAGHPVGRGVVNYVVQGLSYAGFGLRAPVTAPGIAAAWADNVEGLCRSARMELDDEARAEIRAWVGGGLVESVIVESVIVESVIVESVPVEPVAP